MLFCGSMSYDCNQTYEKLSTYLQYECPEFDSNVFGKALVSGLEKLYKSDTITIQEFGERCYRLWNSLPATINRQEPFWTLSYADDCLSYGDEEQSRSLYEGVFAFYDE